MAVVVDPYRRQWTVGRKWWPPDVSDLVDLAFFGWIGVVIALPFALLWPFCVMTKFLGARRVILIDLVTQRWDVSWSRGRSGSKRRINEIALGIAYGDRSGPVVIWRCPPRASVAPPPTTASTFVS